MPKPFRRRAYLFVTRRREGVGQALVFSHASDRILAGVQTPGGTVDAGETPAEAALREVEEETGLTAFGPLRLLAEDEFENEQERLGRSFFQLPALEPTPDAWTHRVGGGGLDGGIDFELRWADLPEAGDLDDHFRAYLDLVVP